MPASRSGLRDFEYMAKALGLLSQNDSVSARVGVSGDGR